MTEALDGFRYVRTRNRAAVADLVRAGMEEDELLEIEVWIYHCMHSKLFSDVMPEYLHLLCYLMGVVCFQESLTNTALDYEECG